MKKIVIFFVSVCVAAILCSCNGNSQPSPEFSDKYLVGNYRVSGGEVDLSVDYDFYDSLKSELKICYDGTVEFYMPTVHDGQIGDMELAGTYKLDDEELESLLDAVDVKRLYNLDPKEDWSVCDGSSKTLDIYDKDDNLLKTCGGYMPRNEEFVKMFKAVGAVIRYDKIAEFREEWIEALKKEAETH